MKRILYYTARDMTNPSLGINKKIINQIETLRKYFDTDVVFRRNDCELVLQKSDGTETLLVSKMNRPYKVEASRGLAKYLKTQSYDGCYIRYVYADMQFHKVLKCLAAKQTKVIVEVPTYPYDAELMDSLENKIVLFLDKMYRNRMKPYVNKIASYSRDSYIYDIPVIQIVNGVNFAKIPVAVHANNTDVIRVIAVADLARWHGYDRFLTGMGEYYKNGGQTEIHFYMVGTGSDLELYQDIVNKYGIQDKVTFCGALYGEELDAMYDKATVAVECLGAHRKGLKLSSSLKSREYAAKGLPMLAAVDIDVFDVNTYPYISRCSGDENPIDMEQVIAFYNKVYNGKDANAIAKEIRDYAQKLCDMDVVMKPIIDELNGK